MKKIIFGVIATVIVIIAGFTVFYSCKKDKNNTTLENKDAILQSVKNTSESMRFRLNEDKSIVMQISYPDADNTTLIVDYSIVPVQDGDDYAIAFLGDFKREEFKDTVIVDDDGDEKKCFSLNPLDYRQVRAYVCNKPGMFPEVLMPSVALYWKPECNAVVCRECGPEVIHTGIIGNRNYNGYVQCKGNCFPCIGAKIDIWIKGINNERSSYENVSIFIVNAEHFIMNGHVGQFDEIFR